MFLLNAVDGCIPADLSVGSPDEIEEERRLLYVALTRAKNELDVLHPLRFYVRQQSRFGDRHVYAPRSRFLPDNVLAQRCTTRGGSALKDRSAGAVIRYNRVEECARSLDLVEAEDFPAAALAEPSYRETFVYGNVITKTQNTGTPIHYGGDHSGASPGDQWGEPIFRKGRLYFFANTLVRGGDHYWLAFFQISTTEETAEIFDNVLLFTGTVTRMALRVGQEVGGAWTGGGTLHLGNNLMNTDWVDFDPDHPIGGSVDGLANIVTTSSALIDPASWRPQASSPAIDASGAAPSAMPVVDFDWDGGARAIHGAGRDLGALEGP